MTGPQLLEDWQVQHVTRLLRDILKRAHGADERYPFPPLAVMVTTYGPTESPRGDVAYEGAIRVRVPLPDGQSTALGFKELWTVLSTQPQLIRAVEPLTAHLTFVLYVYDRLFAWDFRSVVCAMAADDDVKHLWGLLSGGPEQAKNHRRAAFESLSAAEQAQVIRDAVTSDIMEPGKKRVPLRGMLHPGGHSFDTGVALDQFRVFKYFDAALGIGRKVATPERDLSKGDRLAYETAAAPSLTDDTEGFIQDTTATLPPAQQAAVQHWLRAKHLGFTLKEYCKQHSLDYKRVDENAKRGIRRISGQNPKKNF